MSCGPAQNRSPRLQNNLQHTGSNRMSVFLVSLPTSTHRQRKCSVRGGSFSLFISNFQGRMPISNCRTFSNLNFIGIHFRVGLALAACILCVPVGFAAVIFAVLANVERAHMTSLEPPEKHNPEADSEAGATGCDAGIGRSPGPRASVDSGAKTETGRNTGSSQDMEKSTEKLTTRGLPVPPPPPRRSAPEFVRTPLDVHRQRMWQLNRYACLLSTAVIFAAILLLIAVIIFFIYYSTRTKCPLCSRQTWND